MTAKPLYCSFCGKHQDEVAQIIAGPNVNICGECVTLCRTILNEACRPSITGYTRGHVARRDREAKP